MNDVTVTIRVWAEDGSGWEYDVRNDDPPAQRGTGGDVCSVAGRFASRNGAISAALDVASDLLGRERT